MEVVSSIILAPSNWSDENTYQKKKKLDENASVKE